MGSLSVSYCELPLKRVFFTWVNARVLDSVAKVMEEIGGYELLVLSKGCQKITPSSTGQSGLLFKQYSKKEIDTFLSGRKNIVYIERFDELLRNPPDILFIDLEGYRHYNYYESIWSESIKSGKTRVIHYSGFYRHLPPPHCKNYLCADVSIYRQNFQRAIAHSLAWIPWVDGEGKFSYKGPTDSLVIGTYITDYANQYPQDYILFEEIRKEISEMDWPSPVTIDLCDGNVPFRVVHKKMEVSCATLHIKKREGFGYAILESLHAGKPVFIYVMPEHRGNTSRFKYFKWCVEGETAYFFSSKEELYEKLRPFLLDSTYRHAAQERCARKVREWIHFEEEKERLKDFLENLVPQYP